MTGYKRFLSYLFEYEGDQKKENCGFARVEIRGEVQRIFLSVKNKKTAEILHVFGFYRIGEGCRLVPLGRIVVKNGSGQLQYINNGSFLAGSAIRFDELCGLVAGRQEPFSNAYATVWDDKPFGLSLFSKKETDSAVVEQPTMTSAEELETMEINDQPTPNSSDRNSSDLNSSDRNSSDLNSSDLNSSDPNPSSDSNSSVQIEQPEDFVEHVQFGKENQKQVEQKIEKKIEQTTVWEQLSAIYPHIETLPGDSIVCLKAMPADIGRLPRENWVLSSNGFLMYSFVKHRYIVFARISEDHYELWVPGNYEKSEELMAQMFGFYRFRSVKSKKPGVGDFGYWCVPLVFFERIENKKEGERLWQQKMSS